MEKQGEKEVEEGSRHRSGRERRQPLVGGLQAG